MRLKKNILTNRVSWLLGMAALLLVALGSLLAFNSLLSVARADTIIVPEGVCGDQNEDDLVNVLDTILDLKFAVGPNEPNLLQSLLSDLDDITGIDVSDADLGLQHIVGLTPIVDCGRLIEVIDADRVYYILTKSVTIDTEIVPINSIFVNDVDSMDDLNMTPITIDTEIVPINSIFVNDVDSMDDLNMTPITIDTEIVPIDSLFVNDADGTNNLTLEAPP